MSVLKATALDMTTGCKDISEAPVKQSYLPSFYNHTLTFGSMHTFTHTEHIACTKEDRR